MLSILPAPAGLDGLWPIAVTGDIGSFAVAGTDFATLRAAPFAAFTEPVSVRENAFVSAGDAQNLRLAGVPATLVDASGEELARTGEPSSGAANVVASAGSFLVRRPWDFLRVNEAVLGALTESRIEGELSPHAHVSGILLLAPGARVLPGVYIEGVVVIGAGCKVGPNCYIRGATSIGPGCHVGQSVELKNSVLGRKTNVGHLSYVGDSVIGDRVNFGAGTVTSNLRHDGKSVCTPVLGAMEDSGRRKFGVMVGDGVHTGINTSIYPGRKIAPGASTLPASVVSRDITA